MANAIVIKTRVQAQNIDALNRKARCTADVQNGTAVDLAWSTVDGDEVFTATAQTTGDFTFKIGRAEPITIANQYIVGEDVDAWYLECTEGGWIACAPEVNKNVIGSIYKGLDPRDFTNIAGEPFDVIKLEAGDIIQVTKEFFYDAVAPISTDKVVKLTSDGFVASAS